MSTYALQMDCPNATPAEVVWHLSTDCPGDPHHHVLCVPRLETWTLDTLRMVLQEFAAFLPAHDPSEATATVTARQWKPAGRPSKDGTPRPPRFDHDGVDLRVSARGWTVHISCGTKRNEIYDKDGRYAHISPGEWTEPMQAVLLDLAAKSPFPLAGVRVVESSDGWISRRYERRYGRPTTAEPESRKKRLKRLIDDVLGGDR